MKASLKPSDLKLKKKYKILWDDTYSKGGWFDEDDIKKLVPLTIEAIGYYAGKTKSMIVLSQMVEFADVSIRQFGHITAIPKKSIQKITEIK